MKILVVSDTHRHIQNVLKLMSDITDVDRIVHLGDVVGDAEDIESIYTNIPIDYIAGNCDFYETDVLREKILDLCGKKILITHGHLYDVKRGYDKIMQTSLEKNVDAVLFGHTHMPYIGHCKDVILMNPGSISEPRLGRLPSYGLLEIDDKSVIHVTLGQLKTFEQK